LSLTENEREKGKLFRDVITLQKS